MEEAETSLSNYKTQLEQVKMAIQATPDEDSTKEELKKLESDLEELIKLTKENLLELKRKELLAELADVDVEGPTEETDGPAETQEEDPPFDFSTLEGVKCCAPHTHSDGHTTFHNAIICAVESSFADKDFKVRVVFSHPTQPSMLPCPYFLSGNCRFSDTSCKFSHGEVVSLSNLQEFEEPDFSSLEENQRVLAKNENDGLWHHAMIEGIEGNDLVHVRFDHNSKDLVTVSVEMILPLKGSSDDHDGDDSGDDSVDEFENFVPGALAERIASGSSGPLGDWEQHTRGIGSKLMLAMGYIMGEGLGKGGEGRVEPVPAMLYPAGRSLDWCMDLRERSGGAGGDALTVEKTLKRQKEREEKLAARRLEAEKGKISVFDFINHTLGGKRADVRDLVAGNVQLRKDRSNATKIVAGPSSGSSKSDLNLANFKVSEDIRRCEKEIEKLTSSLRRLQDRDPVAARSVQERLKKKQDNLRALHGKEKSLHSKQHSLNEKKKLTIF